LPREKKRGRVPPWEGGGGAGRCGGGKKKKEGGNPLLSKRTCRRTTEGTPIFSGARREKGEAVAFEEKERSQIRKNEKVSVICAQVSGKKKRIKKKKKRGKNERNPGTRRRSGHRLQGKKKKEVSWLLSTPRRHPTKRFLRRKTRGGEKKMPALFAGEEDHFRPDGEEISHQSRMKGEGGER